MKKDLKGTFCRGVEWGMFFACVCPRACLSAGKKEPIEPPTHLSWGVKVRFTLNGFLQHESVLLFA